MPCIHLEILNELPTPTKFIIALILILVFLKTALKCDEDQGTFSIFRRIILLCTLYIVGYSLFGETSFLACIASIVVLAILLRITGVFASNRCKNKDNR